MKVLLATELCRHILRDRPGALLARLQSWSAGGDEVLISAVTYAELVAAALQTRARERHMALVAQFCERLEGIAPWDAAAVDAYTAIQTQAMREGRHLNMNDAMLAAHALSLGAILLVRHAGGLERVEGLEVRVWEEPAPEGA